MLERGQAVQAQSCAEEKPWRAFDEYASCQALGIDKKDEKKKKEEEQKKKDEKKKEEEEAGHLGID